MFLYQKYKYNVHQITTIEELEKVFELLDTNSYMAYDTETTGLKTVVDLPFLYVFGFGTELGWFEPTKELLEAFELLAQKATRLFAFNAKYDRHMTWNFLGREPKFNNDACVKTVARLTEYADQFDDKTKRLNLAIIGAKYVDKSAKNAALIIKDLIKTLKAKRKKEAKSLYDLFDSKGFTQTWKKLDDYVAFTENDEDVELLKGLYDEPNYKDVYELEPDLMISYALDDVVIILEYLKKALATLQVVDSSYKVFNRECDMIKVSCKMERVGFKVDIDYLLKSRKIVSEYMGDLYADMWGLTERKITVNQNKEIARVFYDKYGINLFVKKENKNGKVLDSQTVDKKSLQKLKGDAKDLADIIIEIRTVGKWLSTYIDGKLNAIINGRIHTDIDNSGAVSGRVSSDLQQQPKEALCDDKGNELFHPRKAFITDDDYVMGFFD